MKRVYKRYEIRGVGMEGDTGNFHIDFKGDGEPPAGFCADTCDDTFSKVEQAIAQPRYKVPFLPIWLYVGGGK